MPDKMTIQQRHNNMAAIKGKDTKPEVLVRKFLWSHGFRYRLNHPRLPGKPDIVLRKYRTCIFVNGCFWHGHEGCKYYVVPKSNTKFWQDKILRNPCLFLSSFRLRLRHHFRLFFRQFISSDMMIFQIDMVQRKGERLPVWYPCPLLPPYCCGAVLWSNGPTSLIYHQHLFNIATSQQALCSEPCIAI